MDRNRAAVGAAFETRRLGLGGEVGGRVSTRCLANLLPGPRDLWVGDRIAFLAGACRKFGKGYRSALHPAVRWEIENQLPAWLRR